jgi:hypothetical protein
MSILIPLLVLPVLALVAITLGAIWLTNMLAGQVIGKKHHLLEQIIDTGEVPHDWTVGPLIRFYRGKSAQERQHHYSLHMLDKLIRYVRTTSLVADMETRKMLVDRLLEVRADWVAEARVTAVSRQ